MTGYHLFLSLFILIMAFVVLSGAGSAAGMSWGRLITEAPDGWWNPVSIGMPMVLIFVLAIVPGWITEQDPWQRVWAAKDNHCARNGMLLGSFLVAVVFAGCSLIALGLNSIAASGASCFFVQTRLVIVDLVYTAPMAPALFEIRSTHHRP
jgi:SSS family solute:Na+ symporter